MEAASAGSGAHSRAAKHGFHALAWAATSFPPFGCNNSGREPPFQALLTASLPPGRCTSPRSGEAKPLTPPPAPSNNPAHGTPPGRPGRAGSCYVRGHCLSRAWEGTHGFYPGSELRRLELSL